MLLELVEVTLGLLRICSFVNWFGSSLTCIPLQPQRGLYCPPHKSTGLHRIPVDSQEFLWTPVDFNPNLFVW